MADFFFNEIIKVSDFDKAVVYDKAEPITDGVSVSRIKARTEDGDCQLELDVHSELYPMLPGEKYRMLLSKTLNLDGSAVQAYFPEDYKQGYTCLIREFFLH